MGSLLSEPSCSRPTPGSVPTPTTQHPDKTLWSLLYREMWILIETESDIEIFQMYGIDGAGPAPSLYTCSAIV